MVTIEVDEDNMEEIADEAATLYLTSMLSEWGAYYWAKSLPRFVSYDSLNPIFFFLLGMSPTKRWNSICGSSQPSILLSEGVWLAPCRALASDNGCTWKFLGTNLQRVKP